MTRMRKEAKVFYPTLYVTEAEAKADPVKMVSISPATSVDG